MAHKSKIMRLPLPTHLYFVTAVPSKSHTTVNIDATCLI